MSILSIMPHEDLASRLAGSTRFATASSRFQSSAVFTKLGNSCWILPRRTCNKYLFIIGKILLPKHNHLLSFIAQKQIEYCLSLWCPWIGECALTCSFPIFIGNMSQYCDYEEIEGLKWKTYLCHSWMRPPKMPARPCSAKDCPDSPLPKATPHSWTSARHAPWPRCRRGQQWQLTGRFGVPGLSWDMGEILVALCDSGGGCGGGNVVVKLIWVHWDEKPRKNCFQTIYQHMDAQTVAFFGHPDCQESFSWTVISSAIFKSHPGNCPVIAKACAKTLTTDHVKSALTCDFFCFKWIISIHFNIISPMFHRTLVMLLWPVLTSKF